jgi:O-antigen/teichoic acid export membrane protein
MARMIVERPFASAQPALSHLLGQGGTARARELLRDTLAIAAWLLALMAGGFVYLNHAFVRLWVGEKYFPGLAVNALIIAGFVAVTAGSVSASLCFAAGRIRSTSVMSVLQALVYVPCLVIGAAKWGLVGAAGALVFSVVLTQAWYLPRLLKETYGFSAGDYGKIGRQAAAGSFAAFVAANALGTPQCGNWAQFVASALGFATLYSVVLLVLSAEARRTASSQFQRARWRTRWRSLGR